MLVLFSVSRQSSCYLKKKKLGDKNNSLTPLTEEKEKTNNFSHMGWWYFLQGGVTGCPRKKKNQAISTTFKNMILNTPFEES